MSRAREIAIKHARAAEVSDAARALEQGGELYVAGVADRLRESPSSTLIDAMADEHERWTDASPPSTTDELDAWYIAKCKELADAGNRHGGHVKRFCFDLASDYLLTLLGARQADLVLARIREKYGPY